MNAAAPTRPPAPASLAQRLVRPRGVVLVLGLTALLHLLANGLWLSVDRNHTGLVDGANHLDYVYQVVTGTRLAGPVALLQEARASSLEWPPLVYLVSGGLAAAVDASLPAVRLYSLLYLIVLMLGLYGVGAACAGRGAGLLAAVIGTLIPTVAGASRQIGLDLPCAAMTTATVALLLRTDAFRRPGASLGAGLLAGLALLTRGQSALFLLGPGLVLAGRVVARRDRRAALHLLFAVALAGAMSAVWWWGRLEGIWDMLAVHADAEELPLEGDPSLWGGLKLYIGGLPRLISLPLLLALLAVLPAWLRRRHPHKLELVFWLLFPLLVHVLMVVRNLRYLLPLVPALVAVAAVGAMSVGRRWRRGAVLVTLLAAALPWLAGTTGAARGLTGRAEPLFFGEELLNPECSDHVLQRIGAVLARRLGREHPGGAGLAMVLQMPPDGTASRLMDAALQMRARLPAMVLYNPRRPGAPWQAEALARIQRRYLLLVSGTPLPPCRLERVEMAQFGHRDLHPRGATKLPVSDRILYGPELRPGVWQLDLYRLDPRCDWLPPIE